MKKKEMEKRQNVKKKRKFQVISVLLIKLVNYPFNI